jgi:hypothetical protein
VAAVSEPRAAANDDRWFPHGAVNYFDCHQVGWHVTERDARRDPGAHGDRCLVFASDYAVRRVWIFPPTWRSMSDGELEALSWSPLGALLSIEPS